MIAGDFHSCLTIEIESLDVQSAADIPNPSFHDVTEMETNPCIELVNSSDEEGLDNVKSTVGKRIWRESGKQEWLEIYREYTQERLKNQPQPINVKGILGKDVIVGKDIIVNRTGIRWAGRKGRKLKRGCLKENTATDSESDEPKQAKTVKELKCFTETRRHRNVLSGSSKNDDNFEMYRPEPNEMTSNSVEGVELLIIEDDETDTPDDQNLQKEGNSEELGQYCEEENVLESDFDLNSKDDENYDNEKYEEIEYLIEDSSSHDVIKDTSEEETLDNYNLRYNSLKLLKYSNICLFKWTNNYFVCFDCREWFKDMHLLRNHVESTHTYDQIRRAMVIEKDAYQNAEITDLECKTCSVVLKSLKQLKDHLVEHNIRLKQGGSSLIPYKICTEKLTCQLCEEKFGCVNLIRKHMYGHLNYTDLSNWIIDNKHPISGPTLKSFKHRSKLRGPKIRPEETPFKCKQCPQKFKYDYQRFKHIIVEHKMESILFQCKFCPKIFLTVHWLTKHTNCAHQRELDLE